MSEQDAEADTTANDDVEGVDDPETASPGSAPDASPDEQAGDADAVAADADTATDGTEAETPDDGAEAPPPSLDVQAVQEKASEADEELGEQVDLLVGHLRQFNDRIEELSAAVEERDERIAEQEARIDELEGKLKRKQADFQNYKKRAKKRQDQIRDRATEDLVERIVDVRDNLVRALDQPEGADIRSGVESTLKEFDRILDEEGVDAIEPAPGDEVDPQRHEVMMRVDSEEPEDTIADLYKAGYEMGDKVIQAAQITVSNGSDADGEA